LTAVFLVPLIILVLKQRKPTLKLLLGLLPLASFLLFCWFVKWQPWHSRLHLPLFCLASPIIAVVLSELKKGRLYSFVLGCLVGLAILPSLDSYARPVFKTRNIFNTPSIDLRFRHYPQWKKPQLDIYELIKRVKPSCIQFDLEWAWQYPLQRMILDGSSSPPHFWGQVSPYPSPAPDMVITWAGNSEKSLFDRKGTKDSMIRIEHYHPFIVFVDKSLLSVANKNEPAVPQK
jgi:hypothetical protein